jgi:hypothetical protein
MATSHENPRFSPTRPRFSRAWVEFWGIGFRVSQTLAMEIEVRVSLTDLKRAFRRLLARLLDESEANADFVVFRAIADHLDIVAGGTSEVLSVTVVHHKARQELRVLSFVASLELCGSIAECSSQSLSRRER